MDETLLHGREGRIWEIITWGVFMEEIKKVSFVAAPFMAVAVSQYLLHVVSMMMAGHLAELSLSGVAIATSFCNVTGFSLLTGLASGLEALCGQPYGTMQFQKVGSYTSCAIISILWICLPICLV
ncbi:Multi antimicrobial extrusion protein - like 10 [Theobroma cacao]|nr:Multi antimicrobial extrusion protein - like 10 [Theobroma cacao]